VGDDRIWMEACGDGTLPEQNENGYQRFAFECPRCPTDVVFTFATVAAALDELERTGQRVAQYRLG